MVNSKMRHDNKIKIQRICCIGAGYVGGPTCAVIANKIPSIHVDVVDLNERRIAAWNSDHLPIYEPGLYEMTLPPRDGVNSANRPPNLFFSTQVKECIAAADLIFLCVATPTKYTGTGAGQAADLVYVESATRMIAEASKNDKIVVEKSTVPCKTAQSIREILSAVGHPGVHFDILSNPEFLAEGTAIRNLVEPDRLLIGSLTNDRGMRAAAALVDIYAHWVPRDRIVTMHLWSSEMAKLAANAMLAQRISSINAFSAICEATGADIDEVAYAVGLDRRIGPRMLKSSVGFGGSCFRKDVLNLVYIARTLHLPEVAAYWEQVVQMNEYQKERFSKRIVSCLYTTLTNKPVAILGFAYKKDTGDTRESAAISLVMSLVAEKADVRIYDPKVEEEAIWTELRWASGALPPGSLGSHTTSIATTAVSSQHTANSTSSSPTHKHFSEIERRVKVCHSALEACQGAHAAIIATEWDEFNNKTETDGNTASLANSTALSPNVESSNPSTQRQQEDIKPTLSENGSILIPTQHISTSQNSSTSAAHSLDTTTNHRSTTLDSTPNKDPLHKISHASGSADKMDSPIDRARLDWAQVAKIMQRPMFVFDGRNVVDTAKLENLGFRVESIGKPSRVE